MIKKLITGCLVLATSSLFGMSLDQLNSASKAELTKINGIGDAKADAIIKERTKAKFKSFEDFQRVEGIGEQTAQNVKNDVTASKKKKVTKNTSNTKKKS
ncbi:helix-hairpin-helix domain-containing protein [Sulfurovum sp.]|uniref:ComEA family DNA-binding protein n=1 Tax=Sulfurovum sp. TaxID=1969726 RepID=UPI002867ED15|nr:helix-hairpin-helix domain-containing protein [Sulfurovum sp.]